MPINKRAFLTCPSPKPRPHQKHINSSEIKRFLFYFYLQLSLNIQKKCSNPNSYLRIFFNQYVFNYKKYRTHLGLNKDSPEGRPVQKEGQIEKIPIVNGLHHYYYRKDA
jgi:hypothetical protein